MGLTERQQLERALRESREAAPPDALDADSPCGAADEALTVSLAGGLGDAKAAVKPSRRERELASLAPWAWDPNVDKHRPGRAMMRDFTEVRVCACACAVARARQSDGRSLKTEC